jgi:hypothetical protein
MAALGVHSFAGRGAGALGIKTARGGPEPAHAGFRAPPSPAVGGAWYSFSTMILPHDERGIRWVRSILKVRRHPQYLECKALQFKA